MKLFLLCLSLLLVHAESTVCPSTSADSIPDGCEADGRSQCHTQKYYTNGMEKIICGCPTQVSNLHSYIADGCQAEGAGNCHSYGLGYNLDDKFYCGCPVLTQSFLINNQNNNLIPDGCQTDGSSLCISQKTYVDTSDTSDDYSNGKIFCGCPPSPEEKFSFISDGCEAKDTSKCQTMTSYTSDGKIICGCPSLNFQNIKDGCPVNTVDGGTCLSGISYEAFGSQICGCPDAWAEVDFPDGCELLPHPWDLCQNKQCISRRSYTSDGKIICGCPPLDFQNIKDGCPVETGGSCLSMRNYTSSNGKIICGVDPNKSLIENMEIDVLKLAGINNLRAAVEALGGVVLYGVITSTQLMNANVTAEILKETYKAFPGTCN